MKSAPMIPTAWREAYCACRYPFLRRPERKSVQVPDLTGLVPVRTKNPTAAGCVLRTHYAVHKIPPLTTEAGMPPAQAGTPEWHIRIMCAKFSTMLSSRSLPDSHAVRNMHPPWLSAAASHRCRGVLRTSPSPWSGIVSPEFRLQPDQAFPAGCPGLGKHPSGSSRDSDPVS
jgi:hypothetical protein